jgi:hypothetical protein
MTWWNSTRLTMTSRRVAVALHSVAPPPLPLAALVFPGIGRGGAAGEHQCGGAECRAGKDFHPYSPFGVTTHDNACCAASFRAGTGVGQHDVSPRRVSAPVFGSESGGRSRVCSICALMSTCPSRAVPIALFRRLRSKLDLRR